MAGAHSHPYLLNILIIYKGIIFVWKWTSSSLFIKSARFETCWSDKNNFVSLSVIFIISTETGLIFGAEWFEKA